ncbi:MAG: type II secretion system GspH family protein [Gammaproteobacteria bacterium]|nr:type II secretion system GspH family protein [Gammaproteobacteria bacterium]
MSIMGRIGAAPLKIPRPFAQLTATPFVKGVERSEGGFAVKGVERQRGGICCKGGLALARGDLFEPSRGFSLIELVIVVILISILYVIGIDKLLEMRADAERVALENAVGTLQSALNIEVAAHIARDDIQGLYALEGSNPINRLSKNPKNYLGELPGPDPATIEGGEWYFDTRDGTLVYRVKYADHFKTTLLGPPRARFAVRLDYDDVNGNRVFDKDTEQIHGVRLDALESYAWSLS